MAAYFIFAATYVVLAAGRFPGLRIDRTGASIVGASLMVAFGLLGFGEAVANLIVVQRARREVLIGFWEYFRAGAVLTVLSLMFGAWWM